MHKEERHTVDATDDQKSGVHVEKKSTRSPDGLIDPIAYRGLSLGRITIFCAEPQMGKSMMINHIVRAEEEHGSSVWRYDYKGVDRNGCCDRLVRNCRSIMGRAAKVDAAMPKIAVFECVAPGDEAEVLRESGAIVRLARQGFRVVVSLMPEAEQLAEAMPEAKVIRADSLLYRSRDDAEVAYAYTHGIPALVDAWRLDRQLTTDRSKAATEGRVGTRCLAALEKLMGDTLRDGLCDEEYRLRLAMIALGQGTIDEIAAVCGRCDYEQVAWFERNAPFFGVRAGERRFCCAGVDKLPVFEAVAASLQGAFAREPQLVVHICGMLCARGDVRRSALVCKLSPSEHDICSLGCRWGVSFLQAGEVGLVASSLAAASRLGVHEGVRAILSDAALICIKATSREVEVAKERLQPFRDCTASESRLYAQVDMMVAARDLCRNPQILAVRELGTSGKAADVSGMEHVQVLRLMLEGAFSQAYAVLSNEIMLRRVDTLSEALLSMDLQVVVALSGGALDGSERWLIGEATAFVARMPQGRIRRYHAAVTPLTEVLMGSSEGMSALEDAAAQAERSGDTLLQAAFLTAAAVGDLRARAFSRARVRAMHAATLSHAAGAPYLVSAAELVCALSLTMLGESGPLEAYCLHAGRPHDLHLLGSLAARAAGEAGHGALFPEVPLGTPCPRDALWALNTIAYDCGSLSDEVRRLMPGSWLELLKLARMRQAVAEEVAPQDDAADPQTARDRAGGSLSQGDQSELIPFAGSGQRVRVKVLGGFGVWVDGNLVADKRFERRRSRDLVELLAIAPNHRLRRYQAVRAIWPDEDYYRGPRRLYEATGEVRKLLGGRNGLNAVISDRAQGAVGFDRAVVSCDIDDFEREAHLALIEDRDDFWVLDHARQMCRLYADGPDVHIESLGDEAVGRLNELEDLFVDGLVAAGEAALRLAKARLAVRYATDAYHLRDLREDTVILLVQALRVSGRGIEVRELYQQFSRHLMEAKGMLPSLALRQIVEHALGDEPETFSA